MHLMHYLLCSSASGTACRPNHILTNSPQAPDDLEAPGMMTVSPTLAIARISTRTHSTPFLPLEGSRMLQDVEILAHHCDRCESIF